MTANVANVGAASLHRVSAGSASAHVLMVTWSDAADGVAAVAHCYHSALDLDLGHSIVFRREHGHPDNRSQRRLHFRPFGAFVLQSRCRARHLDNGNRRRNWHPRKTTNEVASGLRLGCSRKTDDGNSKVGDPSIFPAG